MFTSSVVCVRRMDARVQLETAIAAAAYTISQLVREARPIEMPALRLLQRSLITQKLVNATGNGRPFNL